MLEGTCIFLIDTVADVNSVKSNVLAAPIRIDSSYLLDITCISTSTVKTLDRGCCYVMAVITSSHEVDIEIPPRQFLPFDVDISEDFFDSDGEAPDETPVMERIEHICERLHREHHDGQAT